MARAVKKQEFPGLQKCLAMMRGSDAQIQEQGFVLLQPHAAAHLPELMAEFASEQDQGLQCWLLELIGDTRLPAALPLLAEQLRSSHADFRSGAIQGLSKCHTSEARTLLWLAHSATVGTARETAEFRAQLVAALGNGQEKDWHKARAG